MKKISKNLSGTPWHIGFVTKNDDRRDRRNCVYYNKEKKYCTEWAGPCHGSAHCRQYKEKLSDRALKDIAKPNFEVFKEPKKAIRPDVKPSCKLIGMQIVRKHQNKTGKIVKTELNKITVVYDDMPDKTAVLVYPECFINNIIFIEENGSHFVEKSINYFHKNLKKE